MSEHHGGAMLRTLGTSDELLHVASIMQLQALSTASTADQQLVDE